MRETDRRHFIRVDFHSPVHLYQGKHTWEAEVIDISLKGLLTSPPSPGKFEPEEGFDPQEKVQGRIRLGDDAVIELTLRLAHSTNGQYGFYCENIDLESIGHLRRLIELNTGDPVASERELWELINQ